MCKAKGVFGLFFFKNRKTKGHFAHPITLSQSNDKLPEKKTLLPNVKKYLTHPKPKGNFPKIQFQLQNSSLLYHTNCELDKTCKPPTLRPPLCYGEGPQPRKYWKASKLNKGCPIKSFKCWHWAEVEKCSIEW